MFRPGIVHIKFILFIRIMTHYSCFLGIDPALLKSVSVFTLLTSLALVALSLWLSHSLIPNRVPDTLPLVVVPGNTIELPCNYSQGFKLSKLSAFSIQYSNLRRVAGSLDIVLELYLHFLSYSCGNNMLHMKRQDDMI